MQPRSRSEEPRVQTLGFDLVRKRRISSSPPALVKRIKKDEKEVPGPYDVASLERVRADNRAVKDNVSEASDQDSINLEAVFEADSDQVCSTLQCMRG